MKIQCCKCKRVRRCGKWMYLGGLALALASYSYCPDCYRDALAQFRKERELTTLSRGLGIAAPVV